ncbi:plastocyanin/azurin family copper-binding protein [Ideonella sp.]|uniref:cupredoxin domain-containing protein n=1 Tax=Ideonella sp. TaxID=1929293 RepID=UPI0035B399C4
MNRFLSGGIAALAAIAATPSFAHGAGGHAPKAPAYVASQVEDTAFGRQGDPGKVTRTLTLDMSDRMRFTPDQLTLRRGETVRLKVVNKGRLPHELVLGTDEAIRAHWEAMKQHPDMEHDDPSMVHVAPGESGEIVWQFTRTGEFRFACLLPGHFEAGMHGRIVVR